MPAPNQGAGQVQGHVGKLLDVDFTSVQFRRRKKNWVLLERRFDCTVFSRGRGITPTSFLLFFLVSFYMVINGCVHGLLGSSHSIQFQGAAWLGLGGVCSSK